MAVNPLANDLAFFRVTYGINGDLRPLADGYATGLDCKLLLLDAGKMKMFCGMYVVVSDVIVTLKDDQTGTAYLHHMVHTKNGAQTIDCIYSYTPVGEAQGQVLLERSEMPHALNSLLGYPGLVAVPAGSKMYPVPDGWAMGIFE